MTHSVTPQRQVDDESDLLVLLHPLGVDRHFWDAHRPYFADWQVVAPDLPGHGSSQVVLDEPTLEALTEAVLDEIRPGIKRMSLAGVSIGGMVAQQIAIDRPRSVDRVILIDTVAHYPPPWDDMWRSRAEAMRQQGPESLVEATMATWFTEQSLTANSEPVRYARRALSATNPDSYARACEVLADADTRPALHTIAAPTLVLCGNQEPPLFTEGAHELSEAIAEAELDWIHGKHAAALERPAETSQRMRAFLQHA
ncbi:alpha/beta fold hydrolase [uncultured Jatrophihabitans sp.]|uniref:alpha/beta fold hydrolase n=1 Tax=uncultured Jatrophihabitans sp. TaxID=1610747 RepID=UPI0035CA3E61